MCIISNTFINYIICLLIYVFIIIETNMYIYRIIFIISQSEYTKVIFLAFLKNQTDVRLVSFFISVYVSQCFRITAPKGFKRQGKWVHYFESKDIIFLTCFLPRF